jgi:hypothetical protein
MLTKSMNALKEILERPSSGQRRTRKSLCEFKESGSTAKLNGRRAAEQFL